MNFSLLMIALIALLQTITGIKDVSQVSILKSKEAKVELIIVQIT